MAKVATEQIDVEFDALLLDEENPRLGSAADQPEALEKLINLNPTHFRNLMVSIRDNDLDPGDSLYVIDAVSGVDYVVLDGNRRLSAVMVLHNTSLLDSIEITPKVKRSLHNAAKGFDAKAFGEIRCVLFPDRDSANEWIYRRHTGAADGEGRITWGPIEIARFTNNRSVIDVLTFVGNNANYSVEDWEETRDFIESKQSSNIERLLDSAAGRAHMGLSMEKAPDGEIIPTTTRAPAFLLDVAIKIIEDLRGGEINSRDINKASDIEGYFETFPDELQPDPTTDIPATPVATLMIPEPVTPGGGAGTGGAGGGSGPGGGGGGGSAGGGTGGGTKRRAKPKGKRLHLAPKTHEFASPSAEKARNLLTEASKVQLKTFPIAAAFILRAFLELTLRDYAKQHGISTRTTGSTNEKSLTALGTDIKKHIASDANNSYKATDLRPFQSRLLTKTSVTSIQSLNSVVHNKFALSTSDDLRAAWEACIPVFVSTYGEA